MSNLIATWSQCRCIRTEFTHVQEILCSHDTVKGQKPRALQLGTFLGIMGKRNEHVREGHIIFMDHIGRKPSSKAEQVWITENVRESTCVSSTSTVLIMPICEDAFIIHRPLPNLGFRCFGSPRITAGLPENSLVLNHWMWVFPYYLLLIPA